MSVYNSAEIMIEIKQKNNAVIKTKMHVGGRITPLDRERFCATSSLIEINTTDALLQHIFAAYYSEWEPMHWSECGEMWFDLDDDGKKGCEKVLNIDFNTVEEIIIKERFEFETFDFEKVTVQQFVINGENCFYINDQPLFSEEALKIKKPTLPGSVISIGKDAFLGCSKLDVFVEENSPVHMCMQKLGMPHFVISKSLESESNEGLVKRRLHMSKELLDNQGSYFDVMRLVTAEDIYILYINYPEEFLVESDTDNVFFDPADYIPEIIDGKLILKNDKEIHTVIDLATALFYVVSDKIEFDLIKTYLSFCVDKINIEEVLEKFLNCHKVGFGNAFPMGSFDEIKNIDLSSRNEEVKYTILNIIENEFKYIIPDFEEIILPFIEVCNNIQEINEISFVEVPRGIIGENKLDDEEMWECNYKVDFSLLN